MAKSRTRTFCPHCRRVVPAGRTCPCRTDGRDDRRRRLEPWRSSYSDPEYVRNRAAAIERQSGLCLDCGRVCAEKVGGEWRTMRLGGEVDHVVPLSQGGTNKASNLALRCRSCHRRADARRRG